MSHITWYMAWIYGPYNMTSYNMVHIYRNSKHFKVDNNPWVQPINQQTFKTINDVTFSRPYNGAFLVNSYRASDILQRQTGDCWFLAAVAAVAEVSNISEHALKNIKIKQETTID